MEPHLDERQPDRKRSYGSAEGPSVEAPFSQHSTSAEKVDQARSRQSKHNQKDTGAYRPDGSALTEPSCSWQQWRQRNKGQPPKYDQDHQREQEVAPSPSKSGMRFTAAHSACTYSCKPTIVRLPMPRKVAARR